MVHFLEQFVNPKSVVIYGANNELLTTMGTVQLLHLVDNGFKGNIYPIHLKLDTVLGLPAYKSLKDVPEVPDLAIIILRTDIVPQILTELAEKGTKNVVIVTAGFREQNNLTGEQQLKDIAAKYGMKFLGPNCIGFLNTHVSYDGGQTKSTFNCTYGTYFGKPGNVSIASQSGTFTCHTFMISQERDLHLSKAFSVGNEAVIDICDCLEYLGEDPTTDVICLYIEELKRGRRFIELAKQISPKKPIIAVYVGGSEGGSRAVSSHTGSMAGNNQIFDAVFKQTGIIRVSCMEEMFDLATLMSKYIPNNVIPKGRRVAIVTNAGGPGATMSDRASKLGLILPRFSDKLQSELRKYVAPTAAVANPVDYTFQINPELFFGTIPNIICKSGEVDAFICYGAFGMKFFDFLEFGSKILEQDSVKQKLAIVKELGEAGVETGRRVPKKTKVPIVYVNLLGVADADFVRLNENGLVTFKMPHQAVVAMHHFIEYGIYREKIYTQQKQLVAN
jgi:acyl-CoA synthetase (NDP forming)